MSVIVIRSRIIVYYSLLIYYFIIVIITGGVILSDLKGIFRQHLIRVDEYVNFEDHLEKGFTDLLEPFIASLEDDGALPYLIGEKRRYRASPLASSIIWLEDAGLLPIEVLNTLQDKLIFLKDNYENVDAQCSSKIKENEDKQAWSLCEGASVWSTSLAIMALLDHHGNGLKKAEKYKDAIIWLANQQKLEEKGWAYQKWDNCSVNIVMTSLAMQALAMTLNPKNIAEFNFSEENKKTILKALNLGFEYLEGNIAIKNNISYWCFEGKPNCAATTWAMLAIKYYTQVDGIDNNIEDFFKKHILKCMNFIIYKMPKNIEKWFDEQIVNEGGAKYSKQKNYYSFTPTLLIQLFYLGLSPYHPKVINQIIWLLKNKDKWKITRYDVEKGGTFTYAMTVSVVFKWLSLVGCNASMLLIDSKLIKIRLSKKIYGFYTTENNPIKIISKKHLHFWNTIYIVVLFFTILGFFAFSRLHKWLKLFIPKLIPSATDWHDIYISIISTIIIGALSLLSAKMLAIIKRRFL